MFSGTSVAVTAGANLVVEGAIDLVYIALKLAKHHEL